MGRIVGWLRVEKSDGQSVAAWSINADGRSAESDQILKLVTGEVGDQLDGARAAKGLRGRGVTFEAVGGLPLAVKQRRGRVQKSAGELVEQLEQAVKSAGPETDPAVLAKAAEVCTHYRLTEHARKATLAPVADDLAAAAQQAQGGALANAVRAAANYKNDQLAAIADGARRGPTGGTPPVGSIEDRDPDLMDAEQLRVQLHQASDPATKERLGYELTLKQLRSYHRRTGR
jgi:hypothetical protein